MKNYNLMEAIFMSHIRIDFFSLEREKDRHDRGERKSGEEKTNRMVQFSVAILVKAMGCQGVLIP